ncbi:Surfeit locus protein [Nymphaea thermarum]|nr:Surfeit locus protein [Nymphaea thermarum]
MARRQRLEASPSSSSVSTLELLKKSIIDKKSTTEGERGGDSDAAPLAFTSDGDDERNDGGSVTYEELRQRLHRRIEELRGNRNTRDPAAEGKKGKGAKNQQKNQKRGDLGKGEREMNAGSVRKKPTEKKAEESVGEFAFGQVKIGGEQVGKKGKKRKGSKVQELERAKRLKQAMDDPEKGARVSKRHSWSAALSRAEGVKVHDDPRLLKQSIKKEKRRQQKSSKKWKERMEVVEKNKAAKQQTRSGNIADRARDKKMRRIAKREKKLMRPGFEGRKNGFINEASTSNSSGAILAMKSLFVDLQIVWTYRTKTIAAKVEKGCMERADTCQGLLVYLYCLRRPTPDLRHAATARKSKAAGLSYAGDGKLGVASSVDAKGRPHEGERLVLRRILSFHKEYGDKVGWWLLRYSIPTLSKYNLIIRTSSFGAGRFVWAAEAPTLR